MAYLRSCWIATTATWSSRWRPTTPGPAASQYGDVPPYRETQDYVKKVTGASGPVAAAPARPHHLQWIDTVDGKAIVRYSNKPPKGVDAVPVGKR